jgi:hypothetical protein
MFIAALLQVLVTIYFFVAVMACVLGIPHCALSEPLQTVFTAAGAGCNVLLCGCDGLPAKHAALCTCPV